MQPPRPYKDQGLKKKAIDSSLEELRKKFAKTSQPVTKEEDYHYVPQPHKENEDGPFKVSPVIATNYQQLMNLVSNLYVGNLAHEVTEEMLARIYCRYGELESVKLMQPRNEEERKRKRNCAFIKFYKYEAAYMAKEELAEKFLFGQQMRICWAKGISNQIRAQGWMEDYRGVIGDAEVEMNYIEDQLNHVIMELSVPKTEVILEKEYKFFDSTLQRIQIIFPQDLEVRYQIDKVAKMVAQEGQALEEEFKRILLKKKRLQSDCLELVFGPNPDIDLLNYYRWRIISYFHGDQSASWSQHPFQLYQGGPVWIPPKNPIDWARCNPGQVIKEKMMRENKIMISAIKRIANQEDEDIGGVEEDVQLQKDRLKNQQGGLPLKIADKVEFECYLNNINTTRRSICEGMMRAIELVQSSKEVSDIIIHSIISHIKTITSSDLDLKKVYAKLYLISDILFNTANPSIPAAWSYRREFEMKLGAVFDSLNTLWTTKVEGKLSQKSVKKMASRLLRLWGEGTIYESKTLDGWEAIRNII